MSGAKWRNVACRMAVFKSTFLTGVRADASSCMFAVGLRALVLHLLLS